VKIPFWFAPKDRRGECLRCRKGVSVTILVRPQMTKLQVTIHNVSADGIGLLMEAPLAPGTVLALQRLYSPTQSWIRSGKVTRSTQQGASWHVACDLSPPFSEEEMAALVS